jgi:hypothetical protein
MRSFLLLGVSLLLFLDGSDFLVNFLLGHAHSGSNGFGSTTCTGREGNHLLFQVGEVLGGPSFGGLSLGLLSGSGNLGLFFLLNLLLLGFDDNTLAHFSISFLRGREL